MDPFFPVPVVLRKLTGRVRGFCCLGSDYEPIIVINEELSPEQKRRTYEHEMEHIRRGEIYDLNFNEYGESM